MPQIKPLGKVIAIMSSFEIGARIKGVAAFIFWWMILLGFIALIAITVAGWFGIGAGGSADDSREQRQGESDYQYHERLQAEDEEANRDCGFRPAC